MKLTTKLLKEMIRKELKETAFGGKEKYMAKHITSDQMITPEEETKLLSSLKWEIENAWDRFEDDLDPAEEDWEKLYHYDEDLKVYPKSEVLRIWKQAYEEAG